MFLRYNYRFSLFYLLIIITSCAPEDRPYKELATQVDKAIRNCKTKNDVALMFHSFDIHYTYVKDGNYFIGIKPLTKSSESEIYEITVVFSYNNLFAGYQQARILKGM